MSDGIGNLWALGGTVTVIFAATMSAVLIVALYSWLKRYALAKPNARSSHRTPTPQGAGIAVIAATLAAVALGFFSLGALATMTVIAPGRLSDIAALSGGVILVAWLLVAFERDKK
jgi:UDP-N-acetylmuramyl pentapeptide phosphotransferase/UDP-N-acetylglucosamine-1-phosphate transferase